MIAAILFQTAKNVNTISVKNAKKDMIWIGGIDHAQFVNPGSIQISVEPANNVIKHNARNVKWMEVVLNVHGNIT